MSYAGWRRSRSSSYGVEVDATIQHERHGVKFDFHTAVRVRVEEAPHGAGASFGRVLAVARGVRTLGPPNLAQAEAPKFYFRDVRLEGPVRPQGQSVDEPARAASLFGEHHETLRRLGASRKIERARALCRSQLVDLARGRGRDGGAGEREDAAHVTFGDAILSSQQRCQTGVDLTPNESP